jgi:hypothetical protein
MQNLPSQYSIGRSTYKPPAGASFISFRLRQKSNTMAYSKFNSMLCRYPREMYDAIAEAWLSEDGSRSNQDMLCFFAKATNEQLADEAIAAWDLEGVGDDFEPRNHDFDRQALIRSFASIRENFDEHFPAIYVFPITR